MLFELDGCEPHEEDTWDRLLFEIGSAAIRVGGPVDRCAVTTRDPTPASATSTRSACSRTTAGSATPTARCSSASTQRSSARASFASAIRLRPSLSAHPARLADVSGAARSGPRRLRRVRWSARCASVGTTSSSPCSTGAAAASFATSSSRGACAGRRSPTSSTRTSSSRTGLIASRVDAPLVVTAHGRDVRNVGAIPGVAALTRRVVDARVLRDRRVGLPAPRARGEGAGGARQDARRRLGRRPRALPSRA